MIRPTALRVANRCAAAYKSRYRLTSRRSIVAESSAAPSVSTLKTLEDLQLGSRFTSELPGDSEQGNRVRQVHGAFWSSVTPTPTQGSQPYTVAYSADVARLVGLDPSECDRPEFALFFSGNAVLPGGGRERGTVPYAQCYGGHQFGHWASQLGDGRAISLGEATNEHGERWELQLKGAGRTPYSRFADGRAVMRSSVREFVASETMAALGVPTSRALSLVGTGEEVLRDMFYNGNARMEPGAVVCRVAKSWVRFGTFQLPAIRAGDETPLVGLLADYTLRNLYPHLLQPEAAAAAGSSNKYGALLMEVAERTGRLVAHWHRVGFVHGVLNTDNMSILGETIDYGPYGFMERFDPRFTPNTTDLEGRRYAFRNQPAVGQWNVAQLANAMMAGQLVTVEEGQEALERYSSSLATEYEARMADKMGLSTYDKDLSVGLMQLMFDGGADFTNTFRSLSGISTDPSGDVDGLPPSLASHLDLEEQEGAQEKKKAWAEWVLKYRATLVADGMGDAERVALQNASNPAYVPRNHVMQVAIEQCEQGDFSELARLMDVLRRPYEEQAGAPELYREPAPRAGVRMGVELLSCSS